MKFGPEVALDDAIADTKFQGSGYTGSSGKADTRIVLDQFFQSSQCSKSYHNIFTHKSEHFEAKTRLSLTTKKLNERGRKGVYFQQGKNKVYFTWHLGMF